MKYLKHGTYLRLFLTVLICSIAYADAYGDIGIICSTEKEVDLVARGLSSVSRRTVQNRNIVKGQINGMNVVVVRSRMGKSMNAATAQFIIDKYQVEQIASIGFSGGLDESLQPGDVIFALEAGHHDYGTYKSYGFVRREDILKRTEKENDRVFSKWLSNNNFNLVKIVSGDQFIESKKKNKWIRKATSAQVVDMSSSAIFDVCVVNGISCVFIRQISDNANETGQEDYKLAVRDGGAVKAAAKLKKYLSEYSGLRR